MRRGRGPRARESGSGSGSERKGAEERWRRAMKGEREKGREGEQNAPHAYANPNQRPYSSIDPPGTCQLATRNGAPSSTALISRRPALHPSLFRCPSTALYEPLHCYREEAGKRRERSRMRMRERERGRGRGRERERMGEWEWDENVQNIQKTITALLMTVAAYRVPVRRSRARSVLAPPLHLPPACCLHLPFPPIQPSLVDRFFPFPELEGGEVARREAGGRAARGASTKKRTASEREE